jgi:hypothetical protein
MSPVTAGRGIHHYFTAMKGDGYEAARQNEPVEGRPEEKKRQEEPEKIEWGEDARLIGAKG